MKTILYSLGDRLPTNRFPVSTYDGFAGKLNESPIVLLECLKFNELMDEMERILDSSKGQTRDIL